jgi:hypothetical protein
MEKIYIAPSNGTPEINLDFQTGRFAFIGESCHPNAVEFLNPIREKLTEWLKEHPSQALDFQFKFDHLDSPTIKLVMDIIEELEELSHLNKSITVSWHYPEGNRTLKELGQEIATELSHIQMAILPQD